jgi:Flp pilus assembly protein TadG
MLPAFSVRFRVRRTGTGFRRLKGEQGSGLVEYALIFLLFITMLLGIMDFCRMLYAYHFVSSAAREATRYASVRGSTCDDDSSCSLATPDTGPAAPGNTVVQDYVTTLAIPAGINTSSTGCGSTGNSACLTTTATWPVPTPESSFCTANSTAPGCICYTTANYPGCTVEVQVSYSFNFLFPLVHISPVTLSSTSEMVIVH